MLAQKIKKQFILLSLSSLVLITALYLLVQTDAGAKLVSAYLSNSDYSVKISAVSHSLKKPTKITLNNVNIVENKTGNALLQSESITLSSTFQTFWKTRRWDLILVKNAQFSFNLASKMRHYLQSYRFQLQHVTLKLKISDNDMIQANDINGNISTLKSSLEEGSKPVQFNLTVGQILIKDFAFERLAISGFEQNEVVYLTNFGGNTERGFFIGRGGKLIDGDWQIDELQINHLNIENKARFDRILDRSSAMPRIRIGTLNVLESSINLPKLKIEKANIEIKNLMYPEKSDNRSTLVIFDAQNIRWHDELFTSPALKLIFLSDTMIIESGTSKWRKGMITIEGRSKKGEWELEKLIFTGVNLLLPGDWLTGFSHLSLPDYLSNLTIKTWKMQSSVIVSTNTKLALQITGVEGTGNNIAVVKNKKIHFRPENLYLRAENITLNGVYLRLPELMVAPEKTATNDFRHVIEPSTQISFDALVSNGILDATLNVDLNRNKLNSMKLTGHGVSTDVLAAWHILSSPPDGDEFILSLFGTYRPKNYHGTIHIYRAGLHKNYLIEENRILNNSN